MYKCNDRRDAIHAVIAAHSSLKKTFDRFSDELRKALESDTLYNVQFRQESPVCFELIFFDNVNVVFVFETVTDSGGNLHGSITATTGSDIIKVLYFNQQGNITESINQTMSNLNMLGLPGINALVLYFVDLLIQSKRAFKTVME